MTDSRPRRKVKPISNANAANKILEAMSTSTARYTPEQGMFTVAVAQARATLAVEEQLKRIADALERK